MVAHSYPRPYARWPGAADAKAGHFCRASVRECSRRFQPDRSIDLMGLTSNYLTGILNFAAMILSLAVIGAGIWLAHRHETVCVKFLQFPVIALGLFILLVSLAGFIGSCFRIAWLLWIYLLVMLLLILALLAFTAFAFVVTSRGGARHSLAGLGYEEYRLTDYSPWLQDRVKNPGNWAKIKSCLIAARVCVGLEEATFTNYSPLQSLCSLDAAGLQRRVASPTPQAGRIPRTLIPTRIARGGTRRICAWIAIPARRECSRTSSATGARSRS
ncbi:tetraspanin-8 isoform X2 [Selaginella moellendorffii]|uniref:tetraspanin-8 isoform X2 n=1 Tax=Selaginella moellendorffii TaxID=88036 RepID=UPI000D1C9D59|nr:tetraspanin-8 isoform X2 [Selaginella moellendorffii]|eukprot:XP_024530392.1 tetraspanin-8 isoform X2 [Selaginella moellendorffii]